MIVAPPLLLGGRQKFEAATRSLLRPLSSAHRLSSVNGSVNPAWKSARFGLFRPFGQSTSGRDLTARSCWRIATCRSTSRAWIS